MTVAENQAPRKDQRLEKAALAAEIVAAAAVVISLVFVGLQLQRGADEAITCAH
ncbi:MAG: hypothetical protein AAF850_08505 [Pseudomonadota bacterium]